MGKELLALFGGSAGLFAKYGTAGLFAMAIAEASFFPIPPDFVLIPMSVVSPKLSLWYAFICTSGSVLGGLFGYFIGSKAGYPLLKRFASPARVKKMEEMFASYGAWAVIIAGLTPIPYKIFTIASGVFRMNLIQFILASLVGRSLRFFLEALLIMFYGDRILDFISRYFELATLGLALGILGAYFGLVRTGLWDKFLDWGKTRFTSRHGEKNRDNN